MSDNYDICQIGKQYFDESETRDIFKWKKHAYHHCGHFKDHFPGVISVSQAIATYLKIGYP